VRRDTYGIPAAKPREAECKPTPPKKGGRINPPKKPEIPPNLRFVRKRKFKDLTNSTKNSPRTATGTQHGSNPTESQRRTAADRGQDQQRGAVIEATRGDDRRKSAAQSAIIPPPQAPNHSRSHAPPTPSTKSPTHSTEGKQHDPAPTEHRHSKPAAENRSSHTGRKQYDPRQAQHQQRQRRRQTSPHRQQAQRSPTNHGNPEPNTTSRSHAPEATEAADKLPPHRVADRDSSHDSAPHKLNQPDKLPSNPAEITAARSPPSRNTPHRLRQSRPPRTQTQPRHREHPQPARSDPAEVRTAPTPPSQSSPSPQNCTASPKRYQRPPSILNPDSTTPAEIIRGKTTSRRTCRGSQGGRVVSAAAEGEDERHNCRAYQDSTRSSDSSRGRAS